MIHITADTNIFFYLGQKKPLKTELVAVGEELFATPVNVMEIISGITDENWDERRAAAQAIEDYADNMADDPNRRMAKFFSASIPTAIPWVEICQKVASANTLDKLKQQCAFEAATEMRRERYKDFANRLKQSLDQYLNNNIFSKNGKVRKGKLPELWNHLTSSQYIAKIFVTIFGHRYYQLTRSPLPSACVSTVEDP